MKHIFAPTSPPCAFEKSSAKYVRAFGEELARVNLDMTNDERIRYLDWMRETARKHGVKPEPDFPYDRDFES